MPTRKASPKGRTRGAKKVTVRDLVPKRKGNVKGGLEISGVNFAKIDLAKPRG